MRAKIAKWGNSLAVRLPKAAAAEVGLTEGQEVEIETRGGVLQLRPAVRQPRYTLSELVAEMDRLGPGFQPPFEDWGIAGREWPAEDWSDIAPRDDEADR